MGTGSFLGVKCSWGVPADHSPPSSAAVMEEYSYTSAHPLGYTGPVRGSLYPLLLEHNLYQQLLPIHHTSPQSSREDYSISFKTS